MASLKDIANELNLSVPLISKVLSGKMGTTGCTESTRQTILAKAKELNYRPNSRARALSLGRSGTIGVFIHSIGLPGSESLYKKLLEGISIEANAHELRLCLSFYETDSEFMQSFAQVAKKEVDGLLVAGVPHPKLQTVYEDLEEQGIPVVTIFRDGAVSPGGVNICCDEFLIGYMPTRYLLKKGCRRIAHIRSMETRYLGYRKALEEYHLPEDPALIFDAPVSLGLETGRSAVESWLTRKVIFDGLVAETDHQAYGAVSALLENGKKIPEEVKVIGVDNSALCPLCPVPLSSVSSPMEALGRQGVTSLLKRINGEEAGSSIFKPGLQLRASTGDS